MFVIIYLIIIVIIIIYLFQKFYLNYLPNSFVIDFENLSRQPNVSFIDLKITFFVRWKSEIHLALDTIVY